MWRQSGGKPEKSGEQVAANEGKMTEFCLTDLGEVAAGGLALAEVSGAVVAAVSEGDAEPAGLDRRAPRLPPGRPARPCDRNAHPSVQGLVR